MSSGASRLDRRWAVCCPFAGRHETPERIAQAEGCAVAIQSGTPSVGSPRPGLHDTASSENSSADEIHDEEWSPEQRTVITVSQCARYRNVAGCQRSQDAELPLDGVWFRQGWSCRLQTQNIVTRRSRQPEGWIRLAEVNYVVRVNVTSNGGFGSITRCAIQADCTSGRPICFFDFNARTGPLNSSGSAMISATWRPTCSAEMQ